MQEYEITNVAGVEHAKLVLRPGVNILRARNGGGKTSAINAITRAQGGAVDLERRDGAKSGEVRGPGVTLKVGRVVRKTGAAELALDRGLYVVTEKPDDGDLRVEHEPATADNSAGAEG
jgi:DNA repair ATPase RecN